MWGLVIHAAIPRHLREAEQERVEEARRPAWMVRLARGRLPSALSATIKNWDFSSGGELGLEGEGPGQSPKGPPLVIPTGPSLPDQVYAHPIVVE